MDSMDLKCKVRIAVAKIIGYEIDYEKKIERYHLNMTGTLNGWIQTEGGYQAQAIPDWTKDMNDANDLLQEVQRENFSISILYSSVTKRYLVSYDPPNKYTGNKYYASESAESLPLAISKAYIQWWNRDDFTF